MRTPGQRLRSARELKDMSQGDLAQKTNVSKGAISMAERDVTDLTLGNLAILCKTLGVSTDYIVFGDTSERSDDWRRLSSTEEGLTVRQTVLDLYKTKHLREFMLTISRLSEHQLKLLLSMANTLLLENKYKG